MQLHHGIIEVTLTRGPAWLICKKMGIAAFTLGDCVLYRKPPTPNLRVHEARHAFQYRLFGPFFLPLYYILMIRYGYWNNPLEIDARAYEWQKLGSLHLGEIVRRGNNP